MIGLLLAKKIASMFIIIAMGFTIVKTGILQTKDSRPISLLALYVITPCMILSSFQIELTDEVRHGFLLAMLGGVIVHTITIVMTEILGKMAHLDAVEKVSVVYTNAGNLIIPIIMSLFGREWVVYTSGYNIVLNLLMWTHGKAILSGDKKPDFKKIITNFNMIAIFIGLIMLFTGLHFPPILADAVDSVGAMVGPVCMTVTGMIIAGMDMKKVMSYKRAWIPVGLRLIVTPLLVMAVYKGVHLAAITPNGETVLTVSMLAASAPSASSVVQMAQTFKSDAAADYAAAINVIGTLLCILTMPVMLTLFEML